MKSIDIHLLQTYQEALRTDPNYPVISNATIKNGIQAVSVNHQKTIEAQHTFSNEISNGKITSQNRSGRCWIFAGTNLLRNKMMEKYKLENFEFSQNYLMFWDKLEKANYMLESIIATREEDVYSRIVMWLLKTPVQDGGQWDMFANLVRKYGLVPKYIMPETFHSGNTMQMNQLLTTKLRKNASELRKLHQQGKDESELRNAKELMIKEIYRILAFCLGVPPKSFHFEYRDKDDTFHRSDALTPHEFYQEYVHIDLDQYISLINAPTSDKPFNQTYTVEYLGNVIEGTPVLYLNIENQQLKDICINMLKKEETIWFGCDVGKMSDREKGILAADLYLYNEMFDIDFSMSKTDRLEYGESALTHAMHFTGVNLIDQSPNRWKVENSWGEKPGKDGYFVMNDDWFDLFNYQIVTRKEYLSADQLKILEKSPIVLPAWDPMGSLALMQ